MQIGYTKNLLDFISIKPVPADSSADPVLSWSANLIKIGHRKVITAYDSSRCGFVLYGIKVGGVKKLDSLMLDGVRACLESESIAPELIEQYPDGIAKYTIIGMPREMEFEGETTWPDGEVLLSEIFPAYDHIIYNYDFGNDWHHHIKLIRIIDDYDKNYPVCLSGEGDAPPEDVGGPGGYAEMLRVLSDPGNSEYESMKAWVDGMRWKKFDLVEKNRNLRYLSRR